MYSVHLFKQILMCYIYDLSWNSYGISSYNYFGIQLLSARIQGKVLANLKAISFLNESKLLM